MSSVEPNMNNIEKFVFDALEGGWEGRLKLAAGYSASEILLDPASWRAVGETRGWNRTIGTADIPQSHVSEEWMRNMHGLVSYLIEADAKGESQQAAIEKYLGTI